MTNCQPEFDVIGEKKKFHEYSTFILNKSLMKEYFLAMVIEQDTGMRQLVWDEKPTQIHVHLSLKQTKNHVFLTKYVGTIITLQEDLHGDIYAMCI